MEPKGRSQVVEVSDEILQRWKQKAGPRRELVQLYMDCGSKKELHAESCTLVETVHVFAGPLYRTSGNAS